MSVLALVLFNILMFLAIAILWIRQLRPPKEDPRLSRGLQLLQSKIAVLEDLSDRTETQVKQLTQILDERAKNLQTKMLQAEETMRKIEHSMHKSLNVAEIFQDKIPHEEIIERNQRSKYVQVAKLANSGHSVEAIAAQIDLPRNEIEFIAKINREELTFNPELLPEWAKPKSDFHGPQQEIESKMVDRVFHTVKPDLSALHQAEQDFKTVVRKMENIEQSSEERRSEKRPSEERRTTDRQPPAGRLPPSIRKVQFPRITVDRAQLPVTMSEE